MYARRTSLSSTTTVPKVSSPLRRSSQTAIRKTEKHDLTTLLRDWLPIFAAIVVVLLAVQQIPVAPFADKLKTWIAPAGKSLAQKNLQHPHHKNYAHVSIPGDYYAEYTVDDMGQQSKHYVYSLGSENMWKLVAPTITHLQTKDTYYQFLPDGKCKSMQAKILQSPFGWTKDAKAAGTCEHNGTQGHLWAHWTIFKNNSYQYILCERDNVPLKFSYTGHSLGKPLLVHASYDNFLAGKPDFSNFAVPEEC